MQCDKCKKFFPPGFVKSVDPTNGRDLKGNLCVFCVKGKNTLEYDHGKVKVTKKEVLKEYDIFLKKIKDDPDIIKGSLEKEVKEKIAQSKNH